LLEDAILGVTLFTTGKNDYAPSVIDLAPPPDDDGYRLWLRYDAVGPARRDDYRARFTEVVAPGRSPLLESVRSELSRGLTGITGSRVSVSGGPTGPAAVLAGTRETSSLVAGLGLESELDSLSPEGFLIRTAEVLGRPTTVIAAKGEAGVLYGAFHLLRLLQMETDPAALVLKTSPRIRRRVLNHWDHLDRSIERGYAGFSRWDWHKLPDYVSPEITDYARANASIGINGASLTNVNTSALLLTPNWLDKVAALAATLRPWGIRVYLPAPLHAPVELGALDTADPLDANVVRWWKQLAATIYGKIPDFGGFLVNSSDGGKPGPNDQARTPVDRANLLADALSPHDGVVFFRAGASSAPPAGDRARQAYDELAPMDGAFRPNVIVQVKNGPLDAEPREPFHPLLGAMPKTPVALEFTLTQEHLGFATHLVYLGPLFEECLRSDTFAEGPGSTVARVIDGSLYRHEESGIAGVANIGSDRNWCGHPFAPANWYAFGRFAWDPELGSAEVAVEWLKTTFSNDVHFVESAEDIMLASREAAVEYMTPLGLHHLAARDHHFGPGPWVDGGERPDATSVYYHRADDAGIGFDRSAHGSNAVEQYRSPLRERFGALTTCPEELLLWFHHVAWDRKLKSGRTLWDALCTSYYEGAESVARMREEWARLRGLVDESRFAHVTALLAIQEKEARWWRNACVLYFQTFSKRPLPPGLEPPSGTLEEYAAIEHRHVPGTRTS
jgi:alpha-glucuronidase